MAKNWCEGGDRRFLTYPSNKRELCRLKVMLLPSGPGRKLSSEALTGRMLISEEAGDFCCGSARPCTPGEPRVTHGSEQSSLRLIRIESFECAPCGFEFNVR